MAKTDLIQALAKQMDMTAKEAKSIVNTILETMANALARCHDIEIRNFGGVQMRDHDSYFGRIPSYSGN